MLYVLPIETYHPFTSFWTLQLCV